MELQGPVLTLTCGEELLAVPVELVQEILESGPFTLLPNTPSEILGLLDIRGGAVAVADLRVLFGLPPAQDTEFTRIIVLLTGAHEKQERIGVKTDKVIEVTTLDDSRLDPLPSAGLHNWHNQLVAGLGRINGQIVHVLDPKRLFSASGVTLDMAS